MEQKELDRGPSDKEMLEDLTFWFALMALGVPEEKQPEAIERYLGGGPLVYRI